MSRNSTTTARRSGQVPNNTISTPLPYAFVGPKCNNRNRKTGSENACLDEVLFLPYDYDITAWTAHVFVTLYAMTTTVHVLQAILSKEWFLLGTLALSALCETIGWAGRWWSAASTVWEPSRGGYWTSEINAYAIQVITLCIGPCFLAVGWYMLLGRFIRILGPQYSRLTPKLLGSVLTGVMMSALAVDAAGGGLIALAPDAKNSNLGEVVMLVGLVIQIFTILTYSILFAELVWRYSRDRPVKPFRLRRTRPDQFVAKGSLSKSDMGKLKILTIANTVSMGLIFVRTGYRILLIAGGRDAPWTGNEMLFCILDGTLVFLAVATFNFIHPLWFLPPLPPLSDGHLDDPRQDDDASFFDNTPIGHGTKYASADSGRTLSNWGFPKPAYMTQNDARASESGTVDTDGPLEWVPTNERSSQMRPLYEGNVYHGRNASQ